MGDFLLVDEGTLIPADGTLVHATDFTVNESILTGESLPVAKDTSIAQPMVFSGTTVTSGLAIARVTAIGGQTRLGKIGKSMESIASEKTPLEIRITDFVKKMALAGLIVFLLVWALNYLRTFEWLTSLLQALTLAMSILPEEIPVAFTTFMALGAWRLMKRGIIVKQMKTVETLGSATVICTDKTGTLTENRMSLAMIYDFGDDQTIRINQGESGGMNVLETAMWASEPIAFDPMETALHEAYLAAAEKDLRPAFTLVHEYPLGGKPPMMTHVFENAAGERIVAAKGAPEALVACCNLLPAQKDRILEVMDQFAGQGFRVLGVGSAKWDKDPYPANQTDFPWRFEGLVAFHDPPKENIPEVLNAFYTAGIAVKIITGDNALTTAAIARQIGFKGAGDSISGDELMRMPDPEFARAVESNWIFTRMFPEAKLRIINALKANNHVVAMTGDGVNDGPALKSAHIGIAMGQKGTEIAKDAASLILLDDDLSRMVGAVAMGRKIYANLKKAIQYIISIHIPIILTVFIPLAAGWVYPNIFSPIHVIFLELIMGPTCSIIYENEPMEPNTMAQKPKPLTDTFFNWKELSTSIVQGLLITAGVMASYHISVLNGLNENATRAVVFSTLVFANIFLTLVNRSFLYSVIMTMRYKNDLLKGILLLTVALLGILLYVPQVTAFFDFETPSPFYVLLSLIIGFASVAWFEVLKYIRRVRRNRAT